LNLSHWSRRVRPLKLKALALLSVAVFCAITLPACFQSSQTALRIGTITWPGYANFYLARELDYYKPGSVLLTNYSSNDSMAKAFRNGEVDAIAITMSDALPLAEVVPDLRLVLVIDSSDGADVIMGQPSLTSLGNLKGRRVGVEASGLGAFFLTRALETVSLSPKDVNIVPLGAFEHEQGFNQDKVDAVVTFEPTRSRLLAKGANQLFDSSKIPGEIVDVLAVRENVLTRQQPQLRSLIQGWFQARDYQEQQPQDAASRVASQYNISPDEFLKSLEGIHIPTLEENQSMLAAQGSDFVASSEQMVKVMRENQLLREAVIPQDLVDDSIIGIVKASL
jgi:NitT/TauT family transport system substrate-binding protein